MEEFWHDYWDRQRFRPASDETDLYVQVAQTICRQPISDELFRLKLENIRNGLNLSKDDVLVDFCCGNGLFTKCLADYVAMVYALDFSENLIEVAERWRSSNKIHYKIWSAMDSLTFLSSQERRPNKFLMHDSLAYFTPEQLRQLLINVQTAAAQGMFRLLLAGIPNAQLKWNFYNTPERVQNYLSHSDDAFNDGLGRWWMPEELLAVCQELGVAVQIVDQPSAVSNYRMDAIVSPTP